MEKISRVLREIVERNSILLFGINEKIFNLSALAEFLRPQIVARAKKPATKSSILMQLSRLQKNFTKIKTARTNQISLKNLNVRSDLAILTFEKSAAILKKIRKFPRVNFTTSNEEITIFPPAEILEKLKKAIGARVKNCEAPVSAIGVQISERDSRRAGTLHQIIQLISFQGINILEISSTFTEFVFFVASADAKRVFEICTEVS